MPDIFNNLPTDYIVVISFIIITAFYFKEFIQRKLLQNRSKKILEESQNKGYQIIHDAIKKSQDITAEAEIDSLKIAAEFEKYLQELQLMAQKSFDQNEAAIKNYTNQFFEKFEENLTNFFTKTEQQSSQALELETKAARNLIETYKANQLKLVDENILSVLERTLSLVLVKKLSLQDHSELIFQSLEKAKAEKFIG